MTGVRTALVVASAFILSEHHSRGHPESVSRRTKDPCSSLFPARRDKLPRSFAPMKCVGALRACFLFRGGGADIAFYVGDR
jgi:hypothetical protein